MKKIISFSVLMLVAVCLHAQEDKNALTDTDNKIPLVYMQQLQQINPTASTLINSGKINSRVTIVQQIGNDNTVISQTASAVADLGYLQIGNSNNIESYSDINRTSERIIQKGEANEVLNYNFGAVNNSTLNLIQYGNDLSFQKFGTNAQTNNLSFRMSGESRTIIIRSF